MKSTLLSFVIALILLSNANISHAKVIYDTGTPNIMITSPAEVSSKRNTELAWTWLSLKDTPKVDVYLIVKNKKYQFAKDYPNTGDFWWATGDAYTEWDLDIKNGRHTIAVCPAKTKKIDRSCDTFDVDIYGDTPTLKITAPKGGKQFKRGSEMKVSFSGAKKGELYTVNLLYPAKGSAILTLLGEEKADKDGKQSFVFDVPEDIKKGTYTVEIIQTTNDGTCLNVCAQVESKPIKIK